MDSVGQQFSAFRSENGEGLGHFGTVLVPGWSVVEKFKGNTKVEGGGEMRIVINDSDTLH